MYNNLKSTDCCELVKLDTSKTIFIRNNLEIVKHLELTKKL